MKENIIQTQIRLISFRATKVKISSESHTNDSQPEFKLDLRDVLFENSPKLFGKAFVISLLVPGQEEDECYEVEYQTVFECSNIVNEDFLKSEFARISAPAIGFPYVRAFISTISMQAGLQPVILPSINFVQFSKELASRATEK